LLLLVVWGLLGHTMMMVVIAIVLLLLLMEGLVMRGTPCRW
jgi:hypothetical protein